MKIRAIVLCLLLIVSGALYSQTAITLGGNYWRATPDIQTPGWEDVKVSDGNMLGPYVNLRTGKWIIGGSLFVGNFHMQQEVQNYYYYPYYYYYYYYYYYPYYYTTGELVKQELTLKRTDVNLSFGYSITRNITVFGAMKNLKGKFTDFKVNGQSVELNDMEYKGTLFGGGVSGVLGLGRSSFFLFGSLAYLTGKITWPDDDKIEQNLASLTLGAGYRLSRELNLLVGYRSDAITGGDEDESYEKYRGITVSLGYTIQ